MFILDYLSYGEEMMEFEYFPYDLYSTLFGMHQFDSTHSEKSLTETLFRLLYSALLSYRTIYEVMEPLMSTSGPRSSQAHKKVICR